MHFKAIKGTKSWDRLNSIWNKMEKCNRAAADLVEELGFVEFGIAHNVIAGGISCIYSETKPKGWKTVGNKYDNLIYPKVNNKSVLDKIEKLPTISIDEYNETIGFKQQFKGLTHHKSFGSTRCGDMFLIHISDKADFTPPDDLIEILTSEYKTLTKNQDGY